MYQERVHSSVRYLFVCFKGPERLTFVFKIHKIHRLGAFPPQSNKEAKKTKIEGGEWKEVVFQHVQCSALKTVSVGWWLKVGWSRCGKMKGQKIHQQKKETGEERELWLASEKSWNMSSLVDIVRWWICTDWLHSLSCCFPFSNIRLEDLQSRDLSCVLFSVQCQARRWHCSLSLSLMCGHFRNLMNSLLWEIM